MKKEASLPVRLDLDVKRRLKEAADSMGVTTSALIRILVSSFIEEYDRLGGRVLMPPRWQHDSQEHNFNRHAEEGFARRVADPLSGYAGDADGPNRNARGSTHEKPFKAV